MLKPHTSESSLLCGRIANIGQEVLACSSTGIIIQINGRSIRKVKLIKATAEHEKTAVVPGIWERDSDKKKIVEENCCTRKRNYSDRDGSEFETKMTDQAESFQSAAAPAMHPPEFSRIDFALLRRHPTPSYSDAPGRIWGLIPGRGLYPCTIRSDGYLSDSRSQSFCSGCQP